MSQAAVLLNELGWRALWRTRRLTKDRNRRRLAAGIEGAVADAESPRRGFGSAIPVQRRAVIACRDDLLELAERLRAPRPVYAQGVAMAEALLTNSGSALYQSGGDLFGTVERTLAALDGHLG
jgi:hypothetical protein